MDIIFSASSVLVMPFWFLMIFLPTWAWTRRLVGSLWIVTPAAALYVALLVPVLSDLLPLVLRPELEAVRGALGQPHGATLAWAHFLAFDLFVGRWVYLDSRDKRVNVFLMAPILFATLMLGPSGFLLYMMVRRAFPSESG